MKKITTRDIVIPAGSEIISPPSNSTRWGKDHEIIVEVDKDHTGYFTIDLEEAQEAGLVLEIPDRPDHVFEPYDANPHICRHCGAVKPGACYS